MEIATVLFTYNRSLHTKRVLDAIEKGDSLPDELHIFQDGMKDASDMREWENVNTIIKEVAFCNTKLHISEKNKGLANSIIDGLNEIFQKNDAVIVLEDDCVPHPQFMSYMKFCLKKYEKDDRVYSIGGCAWPVDLERNSEDAFFNQRFSSWGWGTWKNQWLQFERDYMLLKRILSDPRSRKRLDIWGADLPGYLIGNITNKCDSWAVFWALKIIEKDGYCLSPYESLITNIGLDGTGTHCAISKKTMQIRPENNKANFVLPETVVCNPKYEEMFQDMFTTIPLADKFKAYQKLVISLLTILKNNKYRYKNLTMFYQKKIAIWGIGEICDFLIQELKDKCDIECIIMSDPVCDIFKNIHIIEIENLPDTVEAIIVVPFYDMDKIKRRVNRSGKEVKLIGFDELICM